MADAFDFTPYTGRRFDLGVFVGEFPGPPEVLAQTVAGPTGTGAAVAGPQKVAQRFLLALLTPLGSVRYHADAGTTFVVDARSGRWRTPEDVRQSFTAARDSAVDQVRAVEALTDPADERIGSVGLYAAPAVIEPGRVSVPIAIATRGTPPVQFLVPIPVF